MENRITIILEGYDCWGKPESYTEYVSTPNGLSDEQIYEFAREIQENESGQVYLDDIKIQDYISDMNKRKIKEEELKKKEELKKQNQDKNWKLINKKKVYLKEILCNLYLEYINGNIDTFFDELEDNFGKQNLIIK